MKTILPLLFLIISSTTQAQRKAVNISFDKNEKRVELAIEQLEKALASKQMQFSENKSLSSGNTIDIIFSMDKSASSSSDLSFPENMQEQDFCIRKVKKNENIKIYVIGGGLAGVMYGGLELAEQIKIGGIENITELDKKPYMNMRGIKFNIPLDVRTPSYTDMSDAGQENIAQMWSFDFWKECIDNLALNRYNFISLWTLHPFPSMVKVPEYPEIALDDVQRSTTKFKEKYNGLGKGFDEPEIINNVAVIKKITIDDKIVFWKKVMRYAKERNIDFYIVTWNIFTYGTKNQYGITDDADNPITIDYFRKSVKQMFITYPDLAGIGLTPGENMRTISSEAKEKWAFDTYGKGMLDASQEMPGRKMTLIHRQHDTDTKKVVDQFQPLIKQPDVKLLFSFKYAQAHILSATKMPFHQKFVKDISDGDLKTLWELRNDDNYYYRWGAPDFVREFIQNIPLDVSEGWYLGSDQWVWGREFLSKNPKTPREIELSKHWYSWMLWGRLGYDPTVTNKRFQDILQVSFPEINGEKLFTAWQSASMIYPLTTGFHWSNFDLQWYIEGAKGSPGYSKTKSGFHDVNFFIQLPPLKGTNYLSIPSYVKNVINNIKTDSISPLEIAKQIHQYVDKSRLILSEFPKVKNDDLRQTLIDIEIIDALGKYYAYKIEGATNLALYREIKTKNYQDNAIEKLNRAAEQWRLYVSLSSAEYKNPLWTNRVGYVNFREYMADALKDVEIAGGTPKLKSMSDSPGGKIISKSVNDNKKITWRFDVIKSGTYYAEIKYSSISPIQNSKLIVNNADKKDFTFWQTGGKLVYGWDRLRVHLKKGHNDISILIPEGADIDVIHLNLIQIDSF